jgi:glutaredoxin
MTAPSTVGARFTRVCMLAVTLAILLAPAVQSATVYRSVDADGKVIYSDKPPASGKVQKTLAITNAPSTPLPESVLRYQAELEKRMKKSLAEAAAPPTSPSLLFVTKTCGYCRQAKGFLAEKGIPFQEHDIETPEGMRAFVAAGGGRQGVPVLVQNDKRLIGYSRPAYEAFFSAQK